MKNLQMGKKKFNMDPKKGIEYLILVTIVNFVLNNVKSLLSSILNLKLNNLSKDLIPTKLDFITLFKNDTCIQLYFQYQNRYH